MNENQLGTLEVGKLMRKFAVPSIIAMLVTSMYNIADQLFIGQAVGTLGNAATNIAYPVNLITLAVALLFGIGGAANFNLSMGKGEKEKAPFYIGNAFMMLIISGVVMMLIIEIFLQPILISFGSPDDVLPYAMKYVAITGIGIPFTVVFVGGGHIVRADGSPTKAMIFNLSGAIINIFLDYLFTMVIKWGIAGAAYATVIGQIFSAILTIIYMTHYRTVKLQMKHFFIRMGYLWHICMLGASSMVNQIAMMLIQIVSNNLLKKYGALSVYGSAIPIACAGIVMKINQIVFGIVIGTAQGCQPIFSFNYGAQKYDRVRKTFRKAITAGVIVSVIFFAITQLFPNQIFAMFANGTEPAEYYEYGAKYMRIFLMFVFLASLQPVTNTFFAAIGKPVKGMIIALVKQVGVLLPVMFILTSIIGVDGVMYAGPVADVTTGVIIFFMAFFEFRNMKKLELKKAQA
jgi:putative MATE family efflux protein